jgi:nucleotide-binding universal stress UspA family protein
MYKTIIWATDGSDGADAALDEALRLVELSGGRIVAVHCDHRLTGRAMAWPALADEDDRLIKIHRQVDELKNKGVDIELVIRRSRREPDDIVASTTTQVGGDVIVCGTRGFGALAGAFLGSFTQRLLHVAPCPVLAVPGRKTVKPESEHEMTGAQA